ncbi:flippase [Kocuria rosea]|uniref:flippase n=1 Tax=Kocuria rosea TaxID=1275 RepID=UPI0025400F0D|nr:flippase [Kocuria rosea]WIG16368.1 flippase [Kocuria rosea]
MSQQAIATAGNSAITLLLIAAVSVTEYGLYSYAIALSSIGMSVMTAGLSGLAVKQLVANRHQTALIVSTLLLAREIFALGGYILVVIVSLTADEFDIMLATLLAASALFGKGLEGPEMWFLSNLRSRATATLRIAIGIMFLLVRMGALFIFPSVWLFLTLFASEAFITGITITVRYLRDNESPKLIKPNLAAAQKLMRQSVPLMLSNVANQINLKGDVVVIQYLLGTTAVGIYSVAAKISELSHFVPMIFMNSLLPGLVKLQGKSSGDTQEYISVMTRAYRWSFWLGAAVALLVGGTGYVLIPIMFGAEYAQAASLLVVHVLSTPFVFMAAVYSKWIIAEGTLWASLTRHLTGATLNISLCFFLIPKYGVMGAAVATVSSYLVASYVSTFFTRQTRGQGVLMTQGMLFPLIWAVESINKKHKSRKKL